MPSRSMLRTGAGTTSTSGAPTRRARRRMHGERLAGRARHRAVARATMIAAFSRAIAATVGPSHSVWSRSTFVIAATPPSQACVASSRPPSPTSTTARSTASRANQRERQRGHQLELGRGAVASGDTIGDGQDLGDEVREGVGALIGRSPMRSRSR